MSSVRLTLAKDNQRPKGGLILERVRQDNDDSLKI